MPGLSSIRYVLQITGIPRSRVPVSLAINLIASNPLSSLYWKCKYTSGFHAPCLATRCNATRRVSSLLFIIASDSRGFRHEATHKTVSLNQRNISVICGQRKKFLWIEEGFLDSKKFSLMWTNLFLWIKEHFYELTKFSLIQRNVFSNNNFF